MAEFASQPEPTAIVADDLMRDRARQFVEFLDDEVSFGSQFPADFPDPGQLQLPGVHPPDAGPRAEPPHR